jgi:ABC-type transporter Mla subunit MlaD
MRRLALIATTLIAASVLAVVMTSASSGSTPIYYVRAIFDNAGFAVPGEQVRIAGAPVGSIQSLDVTADKQAAVTFTITDPRFTPFYANATCAIRPQSLIAERYIDCLPGSSSTAPLHRIARGHGSGSYYLPVTRTNSPVDSDLVQDIYTEPIRERFALILDELGTGLAARGSDLNAVIHRADPALGYTDQVLKILANENHTLADLARDSDTVLQPLANARKQLAGFVLQANTTSVASAARAADIERSFHLFPSFLQQLRPLLVDLGQLADQGTPLMQSLGQSATALGHQFENLTPFANAARPALIALGKSSAESQAALVATEPLAQRLNSLGTQSVPAAASLDKLLQSLNNTGAIEQLMSLLFNGVAATDGFDATGHYVRAEPQVGNCTTYAKVNNPGCSAKFTAPGTALDASASAAKLRASAVGKVAVQAAGAVDAKQHQSTPLVGLLHFLIGSRG